MSATLSVVPERADTPSSWSRLAAGWDLLARFAVRRERRFTLIAVLVFVAINLSTAATIHSSYSTPAQIQQLRTGAGTNAAFGFLLGPLENVQSTASITLWRAGLFLIAAFAVCIAMQAVRLTRKDEELGRVELVRAAPTGPLAGLVAAAVITVAMSVLIALVLALMFIPFGAQPVEVLAVFAQYAATGIAAAGVGLVAAQVATTSHIANITASAVVLVGYLLRGVADATDGWGWLRYLSPIGWAQLLDPFGANNFWWALAALAVGVGGIGAAAWVAVHRDVGAGLIAPRPGPRASAGLDSIEQVVGRLSVALAASWVVGVAVYGLIVGFLQNSVDDIAKGNELVENLLRANGRSATLGELFGATMMGFLAIAAAAWTANLIVRAKAEETAGRTEMLLTAPVSRSRFFVAHTVTAVFGVLAVLLGAATAVTVGATLSGGNLGDSATNAFRSAALQIPACLVVAGAVLCLYGISSRLAPLGWAAVAIAFLCGPLAPMFDLPGWVQDISPFSHTPSVPVEPMTWTPLVVMLCVAAAFTAIGWIRFRVRQVG